jgi:hypothetical protein
VPFPSIDFVILLAIGVFFARITTEQINDFAAKIGTLGLLVTVSL